ncbi:MAG: hypothetical protein NTX43_01330 [Bacteroidetes bacterium]|nr:hypothetical protein [Bacteroidota bacterium]
MRNLLSLNIILFLCLTACNPVNKSQLSSSGETSFKVPVWSSPFLKAYNKALFRTSLNIADKHLTGISIIKRTSDSSFHFTFANEIGMTYFDMELYRNKFKPDYIFDPLDKKSFLKVLQRDFSVLFFSFSEGKPTRKYIQKGSGEAVYMYLGLNLYVWMDIRQNTLTGLAGWSNYFDAIIVKFREYENGFPGEIQIENPRIGMTLTFNVLGH